MYGAQGGRGRIRHPRAGGSRGWRRRCGGQPKSLPAFAARFGGGVARTAAAAGGGGGVAGAGVNKRKQRDEEEPVGGRPARPGCGKAGGRWADGMNGALSGEKMEGLCPAAVLAQSRRTSWHWRRRTCTCARARKRNDAPLDCAPPGASRRTAPATDFFSSS